MIVMNKSAGVKKVISEMGLIIRDVINITLSCLAVAVFIAVCFKNGWLITGYATEVSNETFWSIYAAVSLPAPFIAFWRAMRRNMKS